MTPTPNQSQLQTALRGFLLSILPSGVKVIQGQDNRVPEPLASDFVVMTALRRERLATNTDSYSDVAFMGSVAGNVLDVSDIIFGKIAIGSTLFGPNVLDSTIIQSYLTGVQLGAFDHTFGPAFAVGAPAGLGKYLLSRPQSVSSEKMAAGNEFLLQPVKLTYQLDVHGSNSADNAQTISTLFRDDRATQFFYDLGFGYAPLYADDPRQVPFVNENQQVETRWIVEAQLQANQTVTMPQQFADTLKPNIHVAETYPFS